MNYLLNISSNYRAKFFIGAGLNLLSELGDMYVSDVFACSDRAGSDLLYYNCCLQLTCSLNLEALTIATKDIEKMLGRGSKDISAPNMPIDIDVLAQNIATSANNSDTSAHWQFLAKRLPLTIDVQSGLTDMNIEIADDIEKINKPLLSSLDWWV